MTSRIMLGIVGAMGLCQLANAGEQLPAAPGGRSAGRTLEVIVVGTAPLAGSGIDIDKVPGHVQMVSAADLSRDGGSNTLAAAAALRLSSVNLNNELGSSYQPDFGFRGFEASPVSGVAQGLAVYQSGARINEAFGDTVNWDLVPQFAVSRLTVQSNNPVFGLNALGGAVTLEMKTGFNFRAADAQLLGGSFGTLTGYGEYGGRVGNLGVYVALGGLQDGGFRYQSPSTIRQAYADGGFEDARTTLHLSVAVADTNLRAVGPTPVEMLAQNARAVFTYPQAMHNEAQLIQLSATRQLRDALLLSGNAYVRHFRQHLVDGNTTEAHACGNDAPFFCLEGTGNYPGDALHDAHGSLVPTSVLAPGATPGQLDVTSTDTGTGGAALQVTRKLPAFDHGNHLVIGAAVDRSATDYGARGELGTLGPDLAVVSAGVVIDQALSSTARPPIESPVSLHSIATYYGIYVSDAFDVTPRLTWSVSGRQNTARLSLRDQLGTTLNGEHRYSRFNPGMGVTYKLGETLTAYAGYSEANRAPTAGELSCANPASPCVLGAFLVSDPELRQVVARTYEAGLRGQVSGPGESAGWKWNLGVFRTDSTDDIMRLASPINGFGYYSNVGTTRRQGVETGVALHATRWDVSVNYSLVDGTFRESLSLMSNSPAADASRTLLVRPGDHLPLTPLHRVTLQVEYAPLPRWTSGSDVRHVSRQYLVGDESNQESPLAAFTTVDLHSSLQISKSIRLFAVVDNLFDRTYYTYGAFTRLDGLPPNLDLTDPRSLSPAPGRTFFAGVRVGF